ncbi:hypothetical protein [Subtercola sp. RTI3]|nr:hypothetical protein [Subtercola sp. RTI3]MEA9984390.1 hypothetical protein [Subtercola sp. RTI3]
MLRSLGILQQVVESVDPYSSDVGRLRSDDILPQRVRRPTTLRTDNG